MSGPKKCEVKGCESGNTLFRTFPDILKDRERCLKWIAACGNPLLMHQSLRNKKICDAHFLGIYKLQSKLCKTAVPTLQLPAPIDVSCLLQHAVDHQEVLEVREPLDVHIDNNNNGPCGGIGRLEVQQAAERMEVHTDTGSAVAGTSGQSLRTRKASVLTLFKANRTSSLSPNEVRQYNVIVSLMKTRRQMRKRHVECKERLQHAEMLLKRGFAERIESLPSTVQDFLALQVRNMGRPKFSRNYTLDDKIFALSLLKQSPKVYRYLSNIFLLPSTETLRKLVTKIIVSPGISKSVFHSIENILDNFEDSRYRYCILLFDEMKLSPRLHYNVKSDIVEGLVDFGFSRNRDIADHVQVFMLRGIFGDKPWKQTVSYSFCRGTASWESIARTFKAIVRECTLIRLRVVASVCDQGSTNVHAIKQLLFDTKRDCKSAEEGLIIIDEQKIVPLFDPPHLLKCIRNNLLTKDLRYTLDGVERTAKWSHFEDTYFIDRCRGDFKTLVNITEQHVVPSKIKKMRVKYCTQVFSRKVASLMELMSTTEAESACKSRKMSASGIDTAILFLNLNSLFDSVNSRTILDNESNATDIWNKCINLFQSMRFIKRNARDKEHPAVLQNWIHTLKGFKILKSYLLDLGFVGFRTRDFNQDPLENFFSLVRQHGGRNTNPTCSVFTEYYKSLLINSLFSNSGRQNCEADCSENLLNVKEIFEFSSRNPNSHFSNNAVPVVAVESVESILRNYDATTVNLDYLEPFIQACATCCQAFLTQKELIGQFMREVYVLTKHCFDKFAEHCNLKLLIQTCLSLSVDVNLSDCPLGHLKVYLTDNYVDHVLKKCISSTNMLLNCSEEPMIPMSGLSLCALTYGKSHRKQRF